MSATDLDCRPVVDRGGVTFRLPDLDPEVVNVRLLQEVVHDIGELPFLRTAGSWTLPFRRPPVDRFEYRFEIERAGGSRDAVCDPANPLRAGGPFGERSVVEFPEYRAPRWTQASPARGERTELLLDSGDGGDPQPAIVWSPAGDDRTAERPLLVVLDGFEFDRFSGITQMFEALHEEPDVPPFRALLLHPTRRNEQYSANPAFAEALARVVAGAAAHHAPCPASPSARIGLGASLGALAVLHAHRQQPALFGGLFLQSGSFLRRAHLQGFEYLGRIETFVEEVLTAGIEHAARVEMTCGSVEENLPDNRAVAAALRVDGWLARLHVLADAHNWIAWRDGWDPHLVDLIGELWRDAA